MRFLLIFFISTFIIFMNMANAIENSCTRSCYGPGDEPYCVEDCHPNPGISPACQSICYPRQGDLPQCIKDCHPLAGAAPACQATCYPRQGDLPQCTKNCHALAGAPLPSCESSCFSYGFDLASCTHTCNTQQTFGAKPKGRCDQCTNNCCCMGNAKGQLGRSCPQ